MGADAKGVQDKVQRYLTDWLGSVNVDKDGTFIVRHGSTSVFISVHAYTEENTVVRISALMNGYVPPSPELYRHILLDYGDFFFGHLSADLQDNDGIFIRFSHSLLGEFLDPDELHVAVAAVASIADDLDNEIQDKFGGRLLHEDG